MSYEAMQEDRGLGQPLVMPWERPTRMDEEAEIELEKRRERVLEMEEKIRRIEMELEGKRIAEEAAAAAAVAAAEKEKQRKMMMMKMESHVQEPRRTVERRYPSMAPKRVQVGGRNGSVVVQPVQKSKSQKKSLGEPVYREPVPSMVKITVPGAVSNKRHVVVDRNAQLPIENRILIQVPGGGGSKLSGTIGSRGGRMQSSNEEGKVVIVPGIPTDTRLLELERKFDNCGQVVSCSRIPRWDGSDSEVVSVKFSHPVEAQQALTMSGFRFMKRRISVYPSGSKEANACLAALKSPGKRNAVDSKIVTRVVKSRGIQKKSLLERPARGGARRKNLSALHVHIIFASGSRSMLITAMWIDSQHTYKGLRHVEGTNKQNQEHARMA
eukprot:jgi/Picsp_1/3488/NSC_06326-R1_---NA---